ncbi:MAG TPA: ABC transporter permease [Burkholderiales bacterium]|nr:ABC transporter permease [Burkholderiales bacterium]
MNWQPVILWTDALVWLLTAVVALLLLLKSPHGQLHGASLRLRQMPVAMTTGLVLSVFIAIALLDSLHYRAVLPAHPGSPRQYSVEVSSVLDDILRPLREHKEKTYSAPLATHLYVKENVTLPDGKIARVYPLLRIDNMRLQTGSNDIAHRVARGIFLGLAFAALVAGLAAAWLMGRRRCGIAELSRRLAAADDGLPWRSMLLTVALLSVLTAVMAELAGAFHVLGTDKIGQDVLYETLKSIRTGVLIGTLTTLIMLPFAVLLGISAGYFGGWVDDAIQYLYTTLNAIPSVLLIAAAVLIMQVYIEMHPGMFDSAAARTDFRLLFLCLILGVTSWTGLCRVLRGETLKLRELEYVQAARAFGVSDGRMMLRHILPNLYHLILISVVMDFSGLVLAEAVLSYLGVGVDPAMQSWGNMINAARLEMAREPVVWWPLAAAFSLLFVLVLAANLFADSVRDALDPRGRQR